MTATPNHAVPSAPLFLRDKAEPGFGKFRPGDLEVRIAAALGHAKARIGILLQLGQGRHGADPDLKFRFPVNALLRRMFRRCR